MLYFLSGGPPAWAIPLLALPAQMDAHAAAHAAQMDALAARMDVLAATNFNGSARSGTDSLRRVPNMAGAYPAWFPATRNELTCSATMTRPRVVQLLAFYELPAIAGDAAVHYDQRVAAFATHIGVRL